MHGSLIDKLIELVRRMRSPSSKSFDMLGPGTRVAEQASELANAFAACGFSISLGYS